MAHCDGRGSGLSGGYARRAPRLWSSPAAAVLATALTVLPGDAPGVLESAYAGKDFELTADPQSAPWKDAPRVVIDRDYLARPIAGRPTEVRSRWTDGFLYLLYVCPYDELNLMPGAPAAGETPRLWNRDVAEAFIGSEAERITRYKEFQASPRGEWIDLDIDRENPKGQAGMAWNSGFTVRSRIDEATRTWYAEMRIPFTAIDSRAPVVGRQLRVGLYRIAGADPRTYFAWQPTGQTSFHVPEAFGLLRLR